MFITSHEAVFKQKSSFLFLQIMKFDKKNCSGPRADIRKFRPKQGKTVRLGQNISVMPKFDCYYSEEFWIQFKLYLLWNFVQIQTLCACSIKIPRSISLLNFLRAQTRRGLNIHSAPGPQYSKITKGGGAEHGALQLQIGYGVWLPKKVKFPSM